MIFLTYRKCDSMHLLLMSNFIAHFYEQLKIRTEHTITLSVNYGSFIKGNNIQIFFKKHNSHPLSIYLGFVLKETKDLSHLMQNKYSKNLFMNGGLCAL